MREVSLKRKDGDYDTYTAFDCYDFPYSLLKTKLVKKKYTETYYLEGFATYDIETTTIENTDRPFGFMYHWQMCIMGYLCYGRTWDELHYLMDNLIRVLDISKKRRLVIYSHQLGMEYQFTVNFMLNWYGGFSIFAAHKREPIKWVMNNGLEFRCSYILSNMSLDKATNKERGVIHVKSTGDLDYKVLRTPETFLNDTEFGYCMNDVMSLYEYVYNKMLNENDDISTIPLTSTGYIRRDLKKVCKSMPYYYKDVFMKCRMYGDVYILAKEALRGGNAHASIIRVGEELDNVWYGDARSMYPFTTMLKRFPISAFQYYGEIENYEEFKELLQKYCCMFRVTLENLILKEGQPVPYIDTAHARGMPKHADKDYLYDNGRVLKAKYLDLTLTEIDWKIICQQYDFDPVFHVRDFYIADRGFLPKPIRDKILSYYQEKCKLEFDLEHEKDDKKKEKIFYYYQKAKDRLNSITGMMLTDPVRATISVDHTKGDQLHGWWNDVKPDIDNALDEYYRNPNSYLNYMWGVYITALGREHLQRILNITKASTIYCDTDSDFAIVDDEMLEKINQLNERIKEIDEKYHAYVDYNEKRYYMGVFEKKSANLLLKFKTLGAKKYAYVDEKGLNLTLSGVSKAKGAAELGSIDNFELGFTFYDAASEKTIYNDTMNIEKMVIDGCEIEVGSNIAIVDGYHTIGMTGEYIGVVRLYGGKI